MGTCYCQIVTMSSSGKTYVGRIESDMVDGSNCDSGCKAICSQGSSSGGDSKYISCDGGFVPDTKTVTYEGKTEGCP
jgi:hypothetical protein